NDGEAEFDRIREKLKAEKIDRDLGMELLTKQLRYLREKNVTSLLELLPLFQEIEIVPSGWGGYKAETMASFLSVMNNTINYFSDFFGIRIYTQCDWDSYHNGIVIRTRFYTLPELRRIFGSNYVEIPTIERSITFLYEANIDPKATMLRELKNYLTRN